MRNKIKPLTSMCLKFKYFRIMFLQGFLYITVLALALGCTGRQEKKSASRQDVASTDPGTIILFDGESLKGWEITNFGPQGPVYVSNGNIILGMGDGCTGITWTEDFPVNDYEVELEAIKITGNDFFCGMTFPVRESFCTLIVGGWSGPVTGLSSIDGMDASDNETRTLRKYEHDRWYKIRLRVTGEKIEAWIDNEQVVDFLTEGRDLSIRPEVLLSRPFGICSWNTTAALRNISLRYLNE
jgi:hypothetical protein